jgi:membrane protease YdiL (CAAX protease family)
MRPLRALAIYIVVVFVGGALLAPWLYWLAQSFAHTFPKLAASPFHRYVNRSLLALALLGLWPLLKHLGATSPRDAGLVPPAGQGKRFCGGLLLGFISLAVIAGFALVADARHLNEHMVAGKLLAKLLGIAGTALVVAILEEILFRGALFGALRKVFPWGVALVLSSAVYAIVHFMESARTTDAVTWRSGLELLPRMLRNFGNWHEVIPGFFNLTFAGVLLGLAYQRTGNLYFSIGLHAGWIFWLKSYGLLTAENPGANVWWWGTSRLINGWVALPVLIITLLVFLLDTRRPDEGGRTKPAT